MYQVLLVDDEPVILRMWRGSMQITEGVQAEPCDNRCDDAADERY